MLDDGSMFALGGWWQQWHHPATDEAIESCCIVTCETNELTAKFHNRMPVIIATEDCDIWLTGTPEPALALLKPYLAKETRAYPVSSRVNSPPTTTACALPPSWRSELTLESKHQTHRPSGPVGC